MKRRPVWLSLTLYLLVWVVVLVILTTQTSIGVGLSWEQAFARVFRDWGPWILLGPILWWLVKRFPLFGPRKIRHFGIHLLASAIVIVLAELMVAFVVYPATQPLAQQGEVHVRDLMRELRGERPRPAARNQDYRFRQKILGRKMQLWLLLYWVFALIGTAVLQRRYAEERARRALILKSDLSQTQFRELQSRLNPHFLFNVLNSISALITIAPDKAEEMVSRLSTLLRRVLTSSEQTLIPLSEELSLLRDYLAIEQVRFSDRLTVVEDIDEKTFTASLPPLTLQPIAENAIKHGIEPKTEPSKLEVISRIASENEVELQIVDDGVGFSDTGSSQGFGIGLQNVKDRLENVFPDEASLSVESLETGGARVIITIPLNRKEVS